MQTLYISVTVDGTTRSEQFDLRMQDGEGLDAFADRVRAVILDLQRDGVDGDT